jgi:hypothetical protein
MFVDVTQQEFSNISPRKMTVFYEDADEAAAFNCIEAETIAFPEKDSVKITRGAKTVWQRLASISETSGS